MNGTPELDPIFAKLRRDAWDKALDGIASDKARAIIVQLFARLPETERMALVRELDSIEHPWSDPDVEPEDIGDYWASDGHILAMSAVRANYDGTRVFSGPCGPEWRVRKRWTPEAP